MFFMLNVLKGQGMLRNLDQEGFTQILDRLIALKLALVNELAFDEWIIHTCVTVLSKFLFVKNQI